MDNKEFRDILNLLENDPSMASTAGQINRDISKATGDKADAVSGSRTAMAFAKDKDGNDLSHQDEVAVDPIMKVINFAMQNAKAKPKLVNFLRSQLLPLMKAEFGKAEPEMASVDLSDLNTVEESKEDGKMPSKSEVMKCCKEGMSKADCCKKFPDCDQDKLKELYDSCKSEMKESVAHQDDVIDMEEIKKLAGL